MALAGLVARRWLPDLFRLRYPVLSQCRTITAEIIRQKHLDMEVRERSPMARSLLSMPTNSHNLGPVIRRVTEFAKRRDAAGALECLRQVEDPPVSLHNAVLNACSKAMEARSAWELWATMPEKDLVSYNIMIGLCGANMEITRAEELWQEMLTGGFQPNIVTHTAMITAYGYVQNVDKALETFSALKSVARPDAFAFSAIMSACARTGGYARTRELFVEMTAAEIVPERFHFNSLLTSCARDGDATTAEAIFKMLPAYNVKPTHIEYTTLLGCCRRDIGRCREIFKEMKEKRIQPSRFTLQQLAHAEMQAGNPEEAATMIKEAKAQNMHLTPMLSRIAEELGLQ